MRNQEQRDKVTVEIFTTLLVFAAVAVAGVGSLALVDLSLNVDEGLLESLVNVVLAGALATAAVYLWRHRRP